MTEPLSDYWWLSFIDPNKPPGSQFIGVAIVGPAPSVSSALLLTIMHGCAPRSTFEMAPFRIPQKHLPEVPADKFNRLLTREECSMIGDARSLGEWRKLDREAN